MYQQHVTLVWDLDAPFEVSVFTVSQRVTYGNNTPLKRASSDFCSLKDESCNPSEKNSPWPYPRTLPRL